MYNVLKEIYGFNLFIGLILSALNLNFYSFVFVFSQKCLISIKYSLFLYIYDHPYI